MLSFLRNARFLTVAGLLVVALVISTLHSRAAARGRSLFVVSAVRVALRPFQVAGVKVGDGVHSVTRALRTRSSLLRENRRLRAEVRRLTYENGLLKDAAEQNIRLRRELGFKSSFPLPVVAARVIGRQPSGWFSTCVIDRGTRDGVRPGYAVASFRGLVGQVFEVSPTSSTVLVLSDSTSSIGALVQRSRAAGICKGQNSDVLLLNYLAPDADIRVGDVIVSSGIGQLVPKGLPIGRVIAIRNDPGGFTKHALLRPSVRFDQLEEVFIVVRAEEE